MRGITGQFVDKAKLELAFVRCIRWLERFSDWKVEELKRRRWGVENRRVRYIYLSIYGFGLEESRVYRSCNSETLYFID
jgi:hypothetical protein